MKKKTIVAVMAVMLLSLLTSNAAFAAKSGKCGDNITWTLDDAGNLVLTGSGKMQDYDYLNGLKAPWGTAIKSLSMDESITYIGAYAFSQCRSLAFVRIPICVSSIGRSAFWGCTSIDSVDITNLAAWCGINFNYEWGNPLYYARHILINGKETSEIVIPAGVTTIGFNIFRNTDIIAVTIPKSVSAINDGAFYDCTELKKIEVLAKDPPECGNYVFKGVDKSKCELVVPAGSLDAYKSADVWKNFLNVTTAGVEGVDSDNDGVAVTAHDGGITISGVAASDAVVEVYGMNGTLVYRGKSRSISVPGAGIYAVRVAGKTVKVAVK